MSSRQGASAADRQASEWNALRVCDGTFSQPTSRPAGVSAVMVAAELVSLSMRLESAVFVTTKLANRADKVDFATHPGEIISRPSENAPCLGSTALFAAGQRSKISPMGVRAHQ
jgi:hypothetical protein